VTSREIHEQITAYVDERVDEQEYRSKARQQVAPCPDCGEAYELELKTRLAVQERAPRPGSSDAPLGSIERGGDPVSEERAPSNGAPRTHEESSGPGGSFLTSPVGMIAAALLVIAGLWVLIDEPGPSASDIVDTPAPAVSSDGTAKKVPAENFFNKALQNFEAIRAGQLSPQISTGDSHELSEAFKEKGVGYDVLYPRVAAPLIGGVVSNHGALHFAHIIYTKGEQVYYLFEVPQAELRKGDALYVTKDVMERLDHGEKVWQDPGGEQRLVMFKKGEIVCAMVSNAPRAAMESAAG
jgi:hypothetical protein